MAKHDPVIQANFINATQGCENMKELDLLDALKPTVRTIEKDDTYNTSAKLKIFSLLTSLSNCDPKERMKYVKKIARALK